MNPRDSIHLVRAKIHGGGKHLIVSLQGIRLLPKQIRPQQAAYLSHYFENGDRAHVHVRAVPPAPDATLVESLYNLTWYTRIHRSGQVGVS